LEPTVSGGSFNYLYYAAGDVGEIGRRLDALKEMSEWLNKYAPESHAACDTIEVLTAIAAVEFASDRLRDVWHAIEWFESCDIGSDQMLAALREYQERRDKEEAEDAEHGGPKDAAGQEPWMGGKAPIDGR